MLKKFVIGMTLFVFGAGLLMAHGDELTGTVTAVAKDMVTIKDAKTTKDVQVMLDSKTKYMMGTKAAKMTDVKVGQKVAIDATMDTKMKMYVAESVTLPAAAVKSTTTTTKTTAPKTTTSSTPAPKAPATTK